MVPLVPLINPEGSNFPSLEIFGDPELDALGLIGFSIGLTREQLINGYKATAFPWPIVEEELLPDPNLIPWFCPRERAVIRLEEMYISSRVDRAFRNSAFFFTLNQRFEEVLRSCRQHWSPRTWITEEVVRAYIDLHQVGLAWSIECYLGKELVGGMYGVRHGRVFSAESMFRTRANASKFCLVHGQKALLELGIEYLDLQTWSTTASQFRARTLSRELFLSVSSGGEH